MTIDERLQRAPNLVLGLIIFTIGVALLLDRLQILEASQILRFWPVGLILLGAGVIGQSLARGTGDAGQWHGIAVTPMVLLVVIAIGFTVGPKRRGAGDSRDTVTLFAIMGKDERSSLSQKFQGGDMTSFMGTSRLDLRQAVVAAGDAPVVDVFTIMGSIELRVPQGWIVDVQAVPIMGGVRDERFIVNTRRRPGTAERPDATHPPAEAESADATARDVKAPEPSPATAPRVVLRGFIIMGGLVIKA